MKLLCRAGLCVLLCFPFDDVRAEGARSSSEPVALVYWLQGKATRTVPSEPRRPLRLFDRLPAGATVEVEPGSRLALAFANGRRYELGERSQATLGPKDFSSRAGLVRVLPSVPPFPLLLPIADEEQPGRRPGAVRIRAERIVGLYPHGGAAALAGATVLRFDAVDGAGKYQIEVQDRQGNVVFETETELPIVSIPAGALQPGESYHWTVRTLERVGPVIKGEADFMTLPGPTAEAREDLRKAVEKERDGASLALLAEVDRSLGMLLEARDGLRAALEKSPGDAALQEALSEIERSLGSTSRASCRSRTRSSSRPVCAPAPCASARGHGGRHGPGPDQGRAGAFRPQMTVQPVAVSHSAVQVSGSSPPRRPRGSPPLQVSVPPLPSR